MLLADSYNLRELLIQKSRCCGNRCNGVIKEIAKKLFKGCSLAITCVLNFLLIH